MKSNPFTSGGAGGGGRSAVASPFGPSQPVAGGVASPFRPAGGGGGTAPAPSPFSTTRPAGTSPFPAAGGGGGAAGRPGGPTPSATNPFTKLSAPIGGGAGGGGTATPALTPFPPRPATGVTPAFTPGGLGSTPAAATTTTASPFSTGAPKPAAGTNPFQPGGGAPTTRPPPAAASPFPPKGAGAGGSPFLPAPTGPTTAGGGPSRASPFTKPVAADGDSLASLRYATTQQGADTLMSISAMPVFDSSPLSQEELRWTQTRTASAAPAATTTPSAPTAMVEGKADPFKQAGGKPAPAAPQPATTTAAAPGAKPNPFVTAPSTGPATAPAPTAPAPTAPAPTAPAPTAAGSEKPNPFAQPKTTAPGVGAAPPPGAAPAPTGSKPNPFTQAKAATPTPGTGATTTAAAPAPAPAPTPASAPAPAPPPPPPKPVDPYATLNTDALPSALTQGARQARLDGLSDRVVTISFRDASGRDHDMLPSLGGAGTIGPAWASQTATSFVVPGTRPGEGPATYGGGGAGGAGGTGTLTLASVATRVSGDPLVINPYRRYEDGVVGGDAAAGGIRFDGPPTLQPLPSDGGVVTHAAPSGSWVGGAQGAGGMASWRPWPSRIDTGGHVPSQYVSAGAATALARGGGMGLAHATATGPLLREGGVGPLSPRDGALSAVSMYPQVSRLVDDLSVGRGDVACAPATGGGGAWMASARPTPGSLPTPSLLPTPVATVVQNSMATLLSHAAVTQPGVVSARAFSPAATPSKLLSLSDVGDAAGRAGGRRAVTGTPSRLAWTATLPPHSLVSQSPAGQEGAMAAAMATHAVIDRLSSSARTTVAHTAFAARHPTLTTAASPFPSLAAAQSDAYHRMTQAMEVDAGAGGATTPIQAVAGMHALATRPPLQAQPLTPTASARQSGLRTTSSIMTNLLVEGTAGSADSTVRGLRLGSSRRRLGGTSVGSVVGEGKEGEAKAVGVGGEGMTKAGAPVPMGVSLHVLASLLPPSQRGALHRAAAQLRPGFSAHRPGVTELGDDHTLAAASMRRLAAVQPIHASRMHRLVQANGGDGGPVHGPITLRAIWPGMATHPIHLRLEYDAAATAGDLVAAVASELAIAVAGDEEHELAVAEGAQLAEDDPDFCVGLVPLGSSRAAAGRALLAAAADGSTVRIMAAHGIVSAGEPLISLSLADNQPLQLVRLAAGGTLPPPLAVTTVGARRRWADRDTPWSALSLARAATPVRHGGMRPTPATTTHHHRAWGTAYTPGTGARRRRQLQLSGATAGKGAARHSSVDGGDVSMDDEGYGGRTHAQLDGMGDDDGDDGGNLPGTQGEGGHGRDGEESDGGDEESQGDGGGSGEGEEGEEDEMTDITTDGWLPQLGALAEEGYELDPPLPELATYTEEELAAVRNFTVLREGHGMVCWYGDTDVRGLPLDRIITIDNGEVWVYDDEAGRGQHGGSGVQRLSKPPQGQGLNKPARVTLVGIQPPPNTAPGTFARQLQGYVESVLGAAFITYVQGDGGGVLEFEVQGF